jgi:hypothetical protein
MAAKRSSSSLIETGTRAFLSVLKKLISIG